MLLVVDFYDLGLEFSQIDIRLNHGSNFTVGKLTNKLRDGIEKIGGREVPDRNMLYLLDSKFKPLDPTCRIKDVELNNWDTLYLKRRR